MRFLFPSCILLAAISVPVSAQTTFCSESFDYPPGSSVHNQAGGAGWVNPWWSDPFGASGMDVVSPGIDATGNKGQVVYEYEGAFRMPDGSLAPDLDDASWGGGGVMGKDGGILWISFFAVRPVGCQDQFGGVNMYEQFIGEKLFIGSPWMSGQWGLTVPGVGDFLVAGSSCDVLTNLVARIDFLPGDERVRLYLNPSVPFPVTGESLDMTVPDFRFNEIGLRSGGSTAVGAPFVGGFEFDVVSLSEGEVVQDNSGASDCDCSAASGNCSTVSGAGRGCPNSNANGLGAQLIGSGNAAIGADTFSLAVTDAAPVKPGLIFSGDASFGPSGIGTVPDNAGLLCVGGSTRRGSVVITDANGAASFPDFQGAPYGNSDIVAVGVSVSYTHWFRDPGTASGCAGDTGSSDFNFSNGWTVTWQ
jgi:hypothetical protein